MTDEPLDLAPIEARDREADHLARIVGTRLPAAADRRTLLVEVKRLRAQLDRWMRVADRLDSDAQALADNAEAAEGRARAAEAMVAHSSPELLATRILLLERDARERSERHDAEKRQLQTLLTEAQQIGVKVQRLRQQGRKTVRIAELVDS